MKRRAIIPLTGAGLLAVLTFAAGALWAQEKKMTLDQLPEGARAAIQRLAHGAAIDEVEQETEGGVTVYEASWKVNGAEVEAEVLADGTLLEMEESISAESAPAGVRDAITQHFGNAKVSVEKITIVMYEIEGKVDGKNKEIAVHPTGKVRAPGAGAGGDDEGEDDDDDSGK